MKTAELSSLIFRFRVSMMIFVIGLVLSGITAFPLLHELRLLASWARAAHGICPEGLIQWIETVRDGLEHTYSRFPWVAYETDWLAFGHLVIAMFFVSPLIWPRGSRHNIIVGIVACISIIPLALICGPIRGIPFYWQLIDISFGVFGIIPLIYCLKLLKRIESHPQAPPAP